MRFVVFAISLILFSTNIFSQENRGAEKVDELSVTGNVVDKAYLDYWGISEKEYRRYQYIKENTAREYFTPNDNPIVYLGIEARSEKERRKYAEKAAQLEMENFEKVQAFMNAQVKASVRLYGQGDIIKLRQGQEMAEKLKSLDQMNGPMPSNGMMNFKSRKLFVEVDCDACDDKYKELLSGLRKGSFAQIQVIFNDASDDQIIGWAKRMSVPLDLNERGAIVLRKKDSNETLIHILVFSLAACSASANAGALKNLITETCENVPGDVVIKVVTHESKSFYEGKAQAWPWTLNIDGIGYYYRNKRSALIAAKAAIKRGASKLGIGLGQIEWKYHGQRFDWDVEKALTPTNNIQCVCDVLNEGKADRRVETWEDAIAYYHRPVLDKKAREYAYKVLAL